MRKTFKDFLEVVEWRTWAVVGLAVISTYLCSRWGWEADVPAGLIGLAVVFPIVFSINAAYRRREEVLRYFGGLKGHAIALYYAHRDWAPLEGEEYVQHIQEHRKNVQHLIEAIRDHFLEDGGRKQETFEEIFRVFSRISVSIEVLRAEGVSPTEISRMNQYLSKMMIDFEKMNNILVYRTPASLRAYSTIFLHAFPILFGPFFAQIAADSFLSVGYLVAIVYSLVLVTLDNVQADLEDPFDQVGTDDVNFNVFREYEPIFDMHRDA